MAAAERRWARVHVLHISKTGGTALRRALGSVPPEHGVISHGHLMRLRDVPEDEGVFFVVRRPTFRFVSAFNSRLRKGRPPTRRPWSKGEALAFERFRTPNQLAEALDSADSEEQAAARRAMTDIWHLKMRYTDWLEDEAYLESRRPSIVMVGRTERLNEDFEELKRRLRLPDGLSLPDDPVGSHATPAGFDRALSARGRRNVRGWYRRDIELWKFLVERFTG